MGEYTVALTIDEIAALVAKLAAHYGSRDFDPECPLCTTYRKLLAANGVTDPSHPQESVNKEKQS